MVQFWHRCVRSKRSWNVFLPSQMCSLGWIFPACWRGFMGSLAPTGSRCQHFGGAGTCWAAAVIRAQLSSKLGADKGEISVHLLCKSLEWFQMFPSSLPQMSPCSLHWEDLTLLCPRAKPGFSQTPVLGGGVRTQKGKKGILVTLGITLS